MHACMYLFPSENRKPSIMIQKFPKIAIKFSVFFWGCFSFSVVWKLYTDILVLYNNFHPSHNDHSKEITEEQIIVVPPHRKAKILTEELNAHL